MRKITTWMTVLAVILGAACGAGSAAPRETAVSYEDMEYEHYDPDAFYKDADRLEALAKKGDLQAAEALYDSLYERMVYIDTMDTLSMIAHYRDLNDEYWSDEYIYSDALWTEMSDALCTAALSVLASDIGDDFASYIGEEMAAYLDGYTPMTDEQIALYDRELELVEEYYTLYDSIGDVSFKYLGKTWTVDALYGYSGDILYESDYDGYMTVYEGLNKALCETFAPIYIELAGLYAQDAADAGYDSYADYAYETTYGRDYTPEQAQIFCDAVKPCCEEYYRDLYYSKLFGKGAASGLDTQALFTVMETFLPAFGDTLTEPWQCLKEQELYDIAPARTGRYSGSFETELAEYGVPFLFLTTTGGTADLQSLTHEFGHFTYSFHHPVPNVVESVGQMDLFEIHSNGLQALFSQFYSDIYGKDANAAVFVNTASMVESVIDGCLFDEFQRRTMEDVGSLTAERINEIYLDLCMEYGIYDRYSVPAYDAAWVYIGHLFEVPMYYISYATSAFAALQLWQIAQEDAARAADIYLDILKADAYTEGYLSVISGCGLRTFDEPGAAEDILRQVMQRMERLEWSAR